MNREKYELVLGTVVLVIGIVILLFVLSFALGFIPTAGKYFEEQLPQEEIVQGPSASFSWTTDSYNVSFEDRSEGGDADVVVWDWDLGDGSQSDDQEPSITYFNEGLYNVYLTVEDENGKRSSAFGMVDIRNNETLSGRSQPEFGGFDIGLDFTKILMPLALAVLVVGLILVMAIVGGYITKAGWNLIKPKPETIKVRVKPKDLEVEPIYAPPVQEAPASQTTRPPDEAAPAQVQPQEGPPPPPQQ
ncbi:MAG: PKD domain-containing protein [Thermoplasmata archaeon]